MKNTTKIARNKDAIRALLSAAQTLSGYDEGINSLALVLSDASALVDENRCELEADETPGQRDVGPSHEQDLLDDKEAEIVGLEDKVSVLKDEVEAKRLSIEGLQGTISENSIKHAQEVAGLRASHEEARLNLNAALRDRTPFAEDYARPIRRERDELLAEVERLKKSARPLNRDFLAHLVDVVWQTANEDTSVPSSEWAGRIIDHAFGSWSRGEQPSGLRDGEKPEPLNPCCCVHAPEQHYPEDHAVFEGCQVTECDCEATREAMDAWHKMRLGPCPSTLKPSPVSTGDTLKDEDVLSVKVTSPKAEPWKPNVGDRVRIRKPEDVDEAPTWEEGMDFLDGMESVVVGFRKDSDKQWVAVRAGDEWKLSPSWLTLVEPVKAPSDIKPGDILKAITQSHAKDHGKGAS